MEKNITSTNLSKPSKSDDPWTLIALGGHGKTITIRRFKGLLILTGFGLLFTVAASVFLLGKATHLKKKVSRLQETQSENDNKLAALREERDQLMVRVVKAERKVKDTPPVSQTESITTLKETSDGASGTVVNHSRLIPSTPKNLSENVNARLDVRPPRNIGYATEHGIEAVDANKKKAMVSVADFSVSHTPGSDTIMGQFKLTKVSTEIRQVTGYLFVLFKADNVESEKWLTYPQVPIIQGRPSRLKSGRLFSIANFNTVSFERKIHPGYNLKIFTIADVLIFNESGSILLEKAFPITLN